ncbi:MAG: hypothetical protein V1779_02200 [bacterium]
MDRNIGSHNIILRLIPVFLIVTIISSCSTFNDSLLVKNIKKEPNNKNYIFDLYQYYEKNAMISDQLLTMWIYLIKTDDNQRAKELLDVFYKRLYTLPSGLNKETIYLNSEDLLSNERTFNVSMDLVFGMGKNKILKDEYKNKPYMEKNVEFFRNYLTIVSAMYKKEDKNKLKKNFAVWFFMPYFTELVENNFIEPFTYKIFSYNATDEINNWIKNNVTKMKEFIQWSDQYNWNKK